MTRDVVSTCPICEHELTITRLNCRNCGTSLEGEFSVGRFSRLSREQLALLESFLRSRGNLRELERELGISYPTVRGRVDALLRTLGIAVDDTAERPDAAPVTEAIESAQERLADARRTILQRIADGELAAEAGAAALRDLGKGS
jgi:hypothetical protein